MADIKNDMSEDSDPTPATEGAAESMKDHVRTAGCGFLMGAADIVPGVSGGTLALILGVYERLITAISHCNLDLVRLVLKGHWKAATEHIDLKFVVALGCGILTGIGGLASLMNFLLTDQMSFTFAAFTGMILASSVLVARRVTNWQPEHYGLLLLGIIVALRLVTLAALQNPPDTLWYMFACGMIGITAMILPGISGAFILLLLGRYEDITGSIKGIVHGEVSISVLMSLGVFAAGCGIGLLSFSRVLRWLLAKHHDGTMSVLCGFMLGSLYKLWPFQLDTTPDVEKFKLKVFEHYFPDLLSGKALIVFVLASAGFSLVLAMDAVSRRHKGTVTDGGSQQQEHGATA